MPLGRLQRSVRQLIRRHQRRELGIGHASPGRKPGKQLMGRGGLPVQLQAVPVVSERAGGQSPVLRRLGVPDRLHRVPVPREPGAGGLVQRGYLLRLSTPQLQLQQFGEQVVVAEPRPPRIQRHHERVRGLQVLQDPLPDTIAGQQVGQLAVDPPQHAGAQ